MVRFRIFVIMAALVVFIICAYVFLGSNEVFNGQFKNDYIGWYFLAKGIFCSLSLYLLVKILEALRDKSKQ